MPSVTGIGLDQDPHARVTRDVAQRLGYDIEIPSFIYFKHQSGLREGKKMSSSEPNTAIFLDDNLKEAEKKLMSAFTGGRNTVEEQRKLGGNPDICKVYEMLKFHYEDDKELGRIYSECKQGKWLCGECKKFCAAFVTKFLEKHQKEAEKKQKKAEKIVYG
jgi:tryptophanyl-tRNA synthetase